MNNFKAKLAQFMYGRYGSDQLNNALMVAYFILIVTNTFIRSTIMGSLIWIIPIYIVFRMFSKNVYKRHNENIKFMKVWKRLKAKISLTIRKLKEIKTHRYRKCSHCKAMLHLPRRTGKNIVKCPRCHKEFEVHILW